MGDDEGTSVWDGNCLMEETTFYITRDPFSSCFKNIKSNHPCSTKLVFPNTVKPLLNGIKDERNNLSPFGLNLK